MFLLRPSDPKTVTIDSFNKKMTFRDKFQRISNYLGPSST